MSHKRTIWIAAAIVVLQAVIIAAFFSLRQDLLSEPGSDHEVRLHSAPNSWVAIVDLTSISAGGGLLSGTVTILPDLGTASKLPQGYFLDFFDYRGAGESILLGSGDWEPTGRGYQSRPLSFEANVAGSPASFPFDSYQAKLFFGLRSPQFDIPAFPASMTFKENFSGLRANYRADDIAVTIDLDRPLSEKVLFVSAGVLLFTVVAVLMFAAITLPVRELLPVLLAAAGLVVAVPSLGTVLTPRDIDQRTSIDLLLLLPFLGGSIVVLGLGAIRLVVHSSRPSSID